MESNEFKIKKGVLAKIGGTIALISILFLPLGGCQGATFTGVEVIKASDVGAGIKFMLILSVICGVCTFAVKSVAAYFASGCGGIGGLLIAYMIARQDIPIDLKMGGYLTILGFGLVLVEGFLISSSEPRTGVAANTNSANQVATVSQSSDSPILNLSPQEIYDNGECPECAAEIDKYQDRCPDCDAILTEYM